MEKWRDQSRSPWDSLRDERLDLPPQPRYTPRFASTPIWFSTEKATPGLKTLRMHAGRRITPLSPKPEIETKFPKLRKRIKDIFEKNLKLEPTNITLHKSPEDGDWRILVFIRLSDVDSPLKKLLEIKRELRKKDSELSSKVVVMPSD